jgi:hypothetical protein
VSHLTCRAISRIRVDWPLGAERFRPTGNPASIEAPGRSERYNALLLHGIALHCSLLRFRIAFQNNGAEALPKIVSILSGAVEFFVGRDHGDSQPV